MPNSKKRMLAHLDKCYGVSMGIAHTGSFQGSNGESSFWLFTCDGCGEMLQLTTIVNQASNKAKCN